MLFVQGLITTNRERGFVRIVMVRNLRRVPARDNPPLNSYNDDHTISRNTLQTARSPDTSSSRNQTPIVCYYELNFYHLTTGLLDLDAGRLARSQNLEGPATGHLDPGFLGFPGS